MGNDMNLISSLVMPLSAENSMRAGHANNSSRLKRRSLKLTTTNSLVKIIADEVGINLNDRFGSDKKKKIVDFREPRVMSILLDVTGLGGESGNGSTVSSVVVLDAFEQKSDGRNFVWCTHGEDYFPIDISRIRDVNLQLSDRKKKIALGQYKKIKNAASMVLEIATKLKNL